MNDASFVGTIPQHYDENLGPVIFVDAAADMARRAAATNPNNVLETAAGTGIVTRALRDALPAGTRLVATDLNPPMLEVARRKFGGSEKVDFAVADAMDLPFEDGGFDLVVCQFGVMFYPDKEKSYREVRRVLRSGGHYLFNAWDSHQQNPFGRIAHETVGRFFPDNPPQFQRVPFSYTADEARSTLAATGFTDVTVSTFRLEKPLPEPERLARGVVFGSPLIDQIRERGSVEPETLYDALLEEFRQAFPDGTMPLQALVFSARKP